MEAQQLHLRDVGIDVARVCRGVLIVHGEVGEPQLSHGDGGTLVDAGQLGESPDRAEEDGAVGPFHGRVPVELLAEQAVVDAVVGKHLGIGIEQREAVVGGYPELSVPVFHDAFHGIVGQSLLHGVAGEVLVSALVDGPVVESVFIAAQPQRSVVGLIET